MNFPAFEIAQKALSGNIVELERLSTEFAINLIPGLFCKNEYRFADYGSQDDLAVCVVGPGCVVGTNHALDRAHPRVQTITTELVYRFNWR